MDQDTLGFPLWLRINHLINLFCIFVLMRSGVQILSDHPKLYWNDDTTLLSNCERGTPGVMIGPKPESKGTS